MVEVDFGNIIIATYDFDYSGPEQDYQFALEIGTIIVGPPAFDWLWSFNTIVRRTYTVRVRPGANVGELEFPILEVPGLNPGDTYDMNWEIADGGELKVRKFTNDVISIFQPPEPEPEPEPAEGEFSNLRINFK